MKDKGNIPAVTVYGDTLPQAWEQAILAVWKQGIDIKTEYDKPEDPPSKDATVMVIVEDPFKEPRIHKNFPGGPEELEVYRQEVIEGIHDHWIKPEEGKWTYTYHQRLFSYMQYDDQNKKTPLFQKDGDSMVEIEPIDQIEYMIKKSINSFYSRRTQAITWNPRLDPPTGDPPCLQRVWIRIAKDINGEAVLNMNTHWRSRDLYKAWFMNAYALTDLQRWLAEEISKRWGAKIKVGRYVDISDSLHIYGSYMDDRLRSDMKKMKIEPIDNRVWNSDNEVFNTMIKETKQKIKDNPDFMYKK